MTETDKQSLIDDLSETGAVAFGEFTLTSGQKSNYYVDIKKAITNSSLLKKITSHMMTKIREEGIQADVVAGVELGAIPLVVALALEMDLPFLMIRKKDRTHGTGKRFEGKLTEGQKVLLVEDVTTTGGSVVGAVNALREAGGIVDYCLVVVDRDQGAKELFAGEDINLISILGASDLVRT